MPIYNASRHLADAIRSIQDQSYGNWELLCLDDGSKDDSAAIAQSIAADDTRIRCFQFQNRGIVPTMNDGFRLSSGMLIARMDSDDVSLPDRFQRQIKFLHGHPEIAMVGSACTVIDKNGRTTGKRNYPATPSEIKSRLAKGNCLCHPSMMMRREVLTKFNGPYRAPFLFAEDYDLWLRVSRRYQIANLEDPLLRYRVDSSGMSPARVITDVISCMAARAVADFPEEVQPDWIERKQPVDRHELAELGIPESIINFEIRRALLSAARRARVEGCEDVATNLVNSAGEFLERGSRLRERIDFYFRVLKVRVAA